MTFRLLSARTQAAPSIGVTDHPIAEWMAPQISEAFARYHDTWYLIGDRDGAYGDLFIRRRRAMGIRNDLAAALPTSRLSPPAAPQLFTSFSRAGTGFIWSSLFIDPWGRPCVYHVHGRPHAVYDLYTLDSNERSRVVLPSSRERPGRGTLGLVRAIPYSCTSFIAVVAIMQDASALGERAAIEMAIGEALVAGAKLTVAGLDRALQLRGAGNEHLLALLTKLGLVSEHEVVEALAARLGLAVVSANELPDQPLLEEQLGANFLRHAKVMPLAEEPDGVSLAMADPLDEVTIRAIELRTRKRVDPEDRHLQRHRGGARAALSRRGATPAKEPRARPAQRTHRSTSNG